MTLTVTGGPTVRAQVQFILQVVDEMAMAAAVEAAEEMSRACSRSRSLLTSRIEGGDGATGKIGVKVTPIARYHHNTIGHAGV